MRQKTSDGVITAFLPNFSSSNRHTIRQFRDSELIEDIPHNYILLVYANGNRKENEGYVSITFYHRIDVKYTFLEGAKIGYHVSVEDVAGNKRFTQSVVYFYDSINYRDLGKGIQCDMERYLKRETLLNDPDELLHDDCLFICVAIDITYHFPERISGTSLLDIDNPLCLDEVGRVWILLDSDFVRDLCKVSQYFRCVTDTPMIEARNRRVRIEREEVKSFKQIFCIFYGLQQLDVKSIADIWELYRVADKYDIQTIFETCRQFVKTILRTVVNPTYWVYADGFVEGILKLADHYSDGDMKNAVETYLKIDERFGPKEYALGQDLMEKLSTEWECKFAEASTSILPYFKMNRIVKPEFEFYQ